MKVLLTGGTGFLGRHVADALVAAGHSIRASVRPTSVTGHLEDLGAEIVVADLHSPDTLVEALVGVDAVIHLAGAVKAHNEAHFLKVNSEGAGNLARAAAQCSSIQRFVLVSSQAALGPSDGPYPVTATSPLRPVSAYGRSKAAGERAVLQAVEGSELPVTILRPPTIYGPGDKEVLLLFKLVSQLGVAPVFGDGGSMLSIIFAEDCAAAAALAVSADLPSGTALGLTDGVPHTWEELASKIAAGLGVDAKPVHLPRWAFHVAGAVGEVVARLTRRPVKLTRDTAREMEQRFWLLDDSDARKLLGWESKIEFAEGAAITASWYRQHGWL